MADDPCDACDDPTGDALARTVRLTVDRSEIDKQRLCPDCFAAWVSRYDEEMRPDEGEETDDDGSIIVD
jgi:hypothetical protein